MSGISFCTTCILFFASYIPQGYTLRRLHIEVDPSNVTDFLNKILASGSNKITIEPRPADPALWEEWGKTVEETMWNFFMGKKEQSRESVKSEGRSGLWSAAQSLISNLAVALASNPDEQSIVQPRLEPEQYSLLQDIRSGRIRGPVHVYGRHAAKSKDSSSDSE